MLMTLSPQLQHEVEQKLKGGGYASAEDVLRAGLSALTQLEEFERLDSDSLEAAFPGAREKIQRGLAQARAGNLSDGDEFFDELERDD